MKLVHAIAALGLLLSTALLAQSTVEGPASLLLRGPTPITEEPPAPLLRPMANTGKEMRNYPEQPPVIPHSIEGYQIDVNGNKCLSCHARARTGESKAPMVSISHFMDRDGQFLATVSPRRYFCTQCHVAQTDVKVPVANDFIDIDSLIERGRAGDSHR